MTRVLKIAASFSNKNSSNFRIRTNINATGGSLKVSNDRESFIYTLQAKRDQLGTGLKFLHDVSSEQDFRQREFKFIQKFINEDLASVSNEARALDALHQAAFTGGLGNASFDAIQHIDNITPGTLQNYVNTNFTASRAAIVGVGIEHESLLSFAKSFELAAGSGSAAPSKYVSGQVRHDKAGGLATVAIATQGASLANPKEILAFSVLRTIAGSGKFIREC